MRFLTKKVDLSTVVRSAYSLLGDGAGNEWDSNPEYSRAIAELVREVFPSTGEDQETVLQTICAKGKL